MEITISKLVEITNKGSQQSQPKYKAQNAHLSSKDNINTVPNFRKCYNQFAKNKPTKQIH